ncbi:MAG: molecular chaperone HscC [Cardiobacteriaceae bacterium]|nr:molecular chaperone HscC [Cardiobacteriaceae bacterium]
MDTPILGIDLGTTNSLVAYWHEGKAQLIRNALGQVLTPSVVSVDEDGSILVGQAARERLISHPQATAASFKRFMGSQKRYRLGKRQEFSPEELSALVLHALKADAEAALGTTVHDAVITVPAYFNDTQRKATRQAAELAGLNIRRLLNEPTAAAMAYGLHQNGDDRKFLVLDLGGGTFDVTLLDMFSGIMEVRASAGDNMLGGEDFTELLIAGFTAIYPKEKWAEAQGTLYAVSERAKQALNQGDTDLNLPINGETLNWHITATDWETRCAPLLARCRAPIEQALRDTNIRASQLNDIILVGGATRMSVLRKFMARLFGRFPTTGLNPDETIAIGAAIQAGLIAQDQALEEVVMTDVAPYSLGVETVVQISDRHYEDGIFGPIIERNTVIPVSRVQTYYPMSQGQKSLLFKIYQGEARLVRDNIYLGKIEIPLPAYQETEDMPAEVRFTYDISGLLEIDVHLPVDGSTHQLSIHNSGITLDDAALQAAHKKLAKLKIHPREQTENRTLLARAERLYTQRLGEDRQYIGHRIALFTAALDSQDARTIREAVREMEAFLQNMDDNPWQ